MQHRLKIGQRVYIKIPGGFKYGVIVSIHMDKTVIQFDDTDKSTHFTPREMKFVNTSPDGENLNTYAAHLIESVETDDGQFCLLAIEPEMLPYNNGVSPTGKYIVDCIHPMYGFYSFTIEQNDRYRWESASSPFFITNRIIEWIGMKIQDLSSI